MRRRRTHPEEKTVEVDENADFQIKVGESSVSTSEFIRSGVYTAEDLTMKQRLFVEYYLRHGVLRRALQQAGYHVGDTKNILSNIKVKDVLTRELHRLREQTIAEQMERRAILTSIARGNLREFLRLHADGTIAGLRIPEDTDISCLKEISLTTRTTEDGGEMETLKIKLDDRLKAIDTLNKMDGVYVSKVLMDDSFEFALDPDDVNL